MQMQQDPRSSLLEDLNIRFKMYLLFCRYYQGELFPDALDWIYEEIRATLKGHPLMEEGLSLLQDALKEDRDTFQYDFNRLFLGPGKLLAPPYESAYRNNDGLVMQNETISVRNYYRKTGLEIIAKGQEPDDNISFQLEFICYLLSKEAQALKEFGIPEQNGTFYLKLYHDFLLEHFAIWLPKHTKAILFHSQTKVCKAMALLLQGFLEMEIQRLN